MEKLWNFFSGDLYEPWGMVIQMLSDHSLLLPCTMVGANENVACVSSYNVETIN